MLQQITFLDLESTFLMLSNLAFFLNTKKISLNLLPVRFSGGFQLLEVLHPSVQQPALILLLQDN